MSLAPYGQRTEAVLTYKLDLLADIITDARCALRDALADPSRAGELLPFGLRVAELAERRLRELRGHTEQAQTSD